MSELYDICIKRREPETPVAVDEWLLLIAEDESLSLKEELEARNPMTGETIFLKEEYAAEWSGHPAQVRVRFTFEHGAIMSHWLDDISVNKAQEIADALRAEVIKTID